MYRIGVVQIDSQTDREKNLKRAEELFWEAIEKDVKLVAFPEAVAVADKGESAPENAENGPTATLMKRLAREARVWVLAGSFYEENPGGLRKNTSLLIDPEGKTVARYSKMHLFDADLPDGTVARESSRTSAGDAIVVADTELGKIGMSICYDVRFPELYRLMALKGAEILMVPAAFAQNTGRDGHWKTLLIARAIENGCYVIAPAQTGSKRDGTFITYGHSLIIDPWGTVLAEAPQEGECVLTAEIDPERLKFVRASMPSLANRREDVYKLSEV